MGTVYCDNSGTILQAGDIGVVIMGSDEGTEILITRGGDEK